MGITYTEKKSGRIKLQLLYISPHMTVGISVPLTSQDDKRQAYDNKSGNVLCS